MAVVFLSEYSEYNGVLFYEYRNCRNRDRPREYSCRGIPPKNDYHADFIAFCMLNPANGIPNGRGLPLRIWGGIYGRGGAEGII
jgi:hypothetical protein